MSIESLINGKSEKIEAKENDFFEEVKAETMVVYKKDIDKIYAICEALAKQRDDAQMKVIELEDKLVILENSHSPVSLELAKYDDVIIEVIKAD